MFPLSAFIQDLTASMRHNKAYSFFLAQHQLNGLYELLVYHHPLRNP